MRSRRRMPEKAGGVSTRSDDRGPAADPAMPALSWFCGSARMPVRRSTPGGIRGKGDEVIADVIATVPFTRSSTRERG
jgi:hypothetical protein